MYIGFADVGCLFGELLFVIEDWLFLLRIDCFFCVLTVNTGGCLSLFDC